MADRITRISEELKKEISSILMSDIKDPRLPELISITSVDTTRDLKYAKVYVSVLGDAAARKSASDALKSAGGYIRHELGKRMTIRTVPELIFVMDSSIEKGIYMSKLIDETIKKDNSVPHNEEDNQRT